MKKIVFRLLKRNPYSRSFGFDRGMPIDRYYIDQYMIENREKICGDVLEIAESTYTMKYGGERVNKSIVLHVSGESNNVNIIGNLETGDSIPGEIADCFILTQTLLCIFDVDSAIKNSIKILKPGGCLLLTVPGITQISRFDMDRWGHYWSFTDLSLKRLLEKYTQPENISIKTYGNVKAASAFLYGLSCGDISKHDLDHHDSDYQVLIAASVRKPERE
jgi:hypothetical protein